MKSNTIHPYSSGQRTQNTKMCIYVHFIENGRLNGEVDRNIKFGVPLNKVKVKK